MLKIEAAQMHMHKWFCHPAEDVEVLHLISPRWLEEM